MTNLLRRTMVVVFLAGLVSFTFAQVSALPNHRIGKDTPMRSAPAISTTRNTHQNVTTNLKVWELGTYPGGTWASMGDVNDFGIAVAQGDLPDGSTHNLAVPLFGRHAGEWIDLGTLGGTESGWDEGLVTISDTGLIVGHSASTDQNRPHAIAWTEKAGMVDLGTLADAGYPTYNSSYAAGVNKWGTLIVGWSGVEQSCLTCAPTLPVVWTPTFTWKNGQLVTKWKIHKLDTAGFGVITKWYPWAVNDFGQIVGEGSGDNGEFVGVVWTPLQNGKWKLMQLPASGTQLIQDLIHDGVCGITRYEPTMDKTMRLHSVTSTIENGFVYLPTEADWLAVYLHELTTFPGGKHDDQTDSTSQALDWAKKGMYTFPLFEFFRRESLRNGWPIDPSLLDDDDPFGTGNVPVKCSQCGNNGPAQNGRTYHCNQCGHEWKDIRFWREEEEIYRCMLPTGEILVWDEGRQLWIDPLNGDTYPPGEPTEASKS